MGLEPVFAGIIWVLSAVRRLIPAHAAVNHSGRHGLLLDLQGVFLGHGRGLGILLQPLDDGNVAEVVEAGRSRWKIENENNNTLKTKGYHFEHTTATASSTCRPCWQASSSWPS